MPFCCCFSLLRPLFCRVQSIFKLNSISVRIYCHVFCRCTQGNLVAIKHVNKKRIELTRQVLLDLKHVSPSTENIPTQKSTPSSKLEIKRQFFMKAHMTVRKKKRMNRLFFSGNGENKFTIFTGLSCGSHLMEDRMTTHQLRRIPVRGGFR